MWEFLEIVIPPVVIAAIAIAGLTLVVYNIQEKSCKEEWKLSKMESSFGIWSGCLVKLPDGTWVPSKSIRNF